jgi:hypothetical protein
MSGAEARGRRFSAFGLTIDSEVLLEELPPAEGGDPDVSIRYGSAGPPGPTGQAYSVGEGGALLTVPGVARFLVRDGREIVIERDPNGSSRNLRLFLLGSAFGALLHQRGLLPLHANAIDVGGTAIAFSGHSGAGKSTLAAWFHDRGRAILADDVCVVGFDESNRALAFPGIPRLRLWREALEASGRDADQYNRSFDDMDKYDVPTRTEALPPLPLVAIYLLRKVPEAQPEGTIRRLKGVEAVDALVANTYRGGYLKAIGRTGEHLAACVNLARAVPVFEATRRWGFDSFDEQARRLEAHGRAQAGRP